MNEYRPNTSYAFGLSIASNSERALHSGQGLAEAYWSARNMSANFLGQPDDEAVNTVACAELGPSMGIMALASFLAEVDRPMMYSAFAPLCRNPFQNVVFKNIGRA